MLALDAIVAGVKLLLKSLLALAMIALALVLLFLGFAAYFVICDWTDNKMVEEIEG